MRRALVQQGVGQHLLSVLIYDKSVGYGHSISSEPCCPLLNNYEVMTICWGQASCTANLPDNSET